MALYPRPSQPPPPPGKTEFEILKASHKFLREDDSGATGQSLSWDEQLATKYYESLFREYAVCDLKHYKSGNFALRWRTESEVLVGAGETSCGNTRCRHHHEQRGIALSTLELPFVYAEHGQTKSALVKAVLCARCVGKLMWKRRKEKAGAAGDVGTAGAGDVEDGGDAVVKREEIEPVLAPDERGGRRVRRKQGEEGNDDSRRRRRRDSRSRSPRPSNHRRDAERPRPSR
ncbi:folate-sensitive fragile site protein Fra10Ac1-domain-containing protein [Mycena rebaudengoi]|nr:folate-sensitive fragile site protein Fra10Ac1-domain-containing protein [Mycena rebaudengoi]